jgi:hypothetical protein
VVRDERRVFIDAQDDPALARPQPREADEVDALDAGSFRLPPKIGWMLDTWHTRAHETAEKGESAAATTTKTEEDAETV